MIWPKHKDPTQSHRRAKAPYNFVPLPEKVVPAELLLDESTYYPDRHTGWLDCTLTTASPLYVRCGVLPSQFDQVEAKDLPEFFYTDPDILEPVIPGSSLRGMLRVMVEIVGYGKVQPVSKECLVYRAVGDTTSLGIGYRQRLMHEDSKNHFTPLMQAGYMIKRGLDWHIQPARNIGGATFARIWRESVPDNLPAWHGCQNAHCIWVKPGPYQYQKVRGGFIHIKYINVQESSATPMEGFIGGVHIRSGKMLSKKFDMVIFPANEATELIPVPEELVTAYRDQLSKEQIALLGRDGVLRDKQPVFYLMEKGYLVFFSHTAMLRLPYPKSPNDFIPAKLRDPSETDLAEALFGYVESDEKATRPVARAGRVFVSDATLESGQSDRWLSKQPITPKILSGPKPTTFQHYLTQKTPDEQPAGQTKNGEPRYKVVLSHYASPTPQETVIRGHKLYWHKGEVKQADFEESDPTKRGDSQHTSIKPVRSDIRFHFCIRFENLSNAELGALLWLLDIAKDTNYRLKLGMGKPLGMGAVKVEAQLHLTDRVSRYASLFEGDAWAIGTRTDADAVWHKAVQAFEQRVLSDPEVNPHSVSSLVEVERAKMLLWMLSWPGPSSDQTRYLEIEHPVNKNEYKDRPVLPTPLGVIGVDTTTPTRSPASPPKQRVERKPTPDLPTSVSHPASVNEIKQGDLLEGRVIAVEPNRVVIDVGVAKGSMGLEQLNRLVQVDEWFRRTYPGQTLTAQALYEKGELEDIMVGTRMQVLVRKVEMIQGKPKIKLSFVAWMAK
jgi:CRISPR-associated protein (TIGR03986 family)